MCVCVCVCLCMCELFCVAGYSGCRHDPQSQVLCLVSSLSVGDVDGGRWPGRWSLYTYVYT